MRNLTLSCCSQNKGNKYYHKKGLTKIISHRSIFENQGMIVLRRYTPQRSKKIKDMAHRIYTTIDIEMNENDPIRIELGNW